MAYAKILDIDYTKLESDLMALGADKVLETNFIIDWFRQMGVRQGNDPWTIRIESTNHGHHRCVWNGLGDEISFDIGDAHQARRMFEKMGLECFSHQEKYVTEFEYNDWKFLVYQYPHMPTFLSIEGADTQRIEEAVQLLNLINHPETQHSDQDIVQNIYRLNWHSLTF